MGQKENRPLELVVLSNAPPQQQLQKTNRWLLQAVLFLMTIIFVGGFFLLPDSGFLGNSPKEARTADYASNAPQLSAEVNMLKNQMVGLVSGSIESKLRSLEESLRTGTLTNSLGTLEDIKNDLKVLKTYSESSQTTAIASVGVSNQALMAEMSQLKRLIYWTLASCSLMVGAIAGIWLKNTKQLPSKAAIIRYLTRHQG